MRALICPFLGHFAAADGESSSGNGGKEGESGDYYVMKLLPESELNSAITEMLSQVITIVIIIIIKPIFIINNIIIIITFIINIIITRTRSR